MSIMGTAVGLPTPAADWAQTDSGKADFIRNKPDVDAIRTLAENALPKSGGAMTGNLGMSGNRVTGLGEPVDAGDAANKAYVDGKRFTFTGTLMAGWWSDSAPYVQGVVIPSINESDMPHITPVYSTTNSTAIAQKEAWACVSKAVAGAGLITFTCFEDKPATEIPIQIEVTR